MLGEVEGLTFRLEILSIAQVELLHPFQNTDVVKIESLGYRTFGFVFHQKVMHCPCKRVRVEQQIVNALARLHLINVRPDPN